MTNENPYSTNNQFGCLHNDETSQVNHQSSKEGCDQNFNPDYSVQRSI